LPRRAPGPGGNGGCILGDVRDPRSAAVARVLRDPDTRPGRLFLARHKGHTGET